MTSTPSIKDSPIRPQLQRETTPTTTTAPQISTPQRRAAGPEGLPRARSASGSTSVNPAPRSIILRPLGGMGPAAGVEGARNLVDQAVALHDKTGARINAVVVQATDVSDRTAALLTGGKDPSKAMARAMGRTARGTAPGDVVVKGFYCNTANKFLDAMKAIAAQKHLPVDHVHIADATLRLAVAAAEESGVGAKEPIRIGLLATSGTIKTEVYHDRAKALSAELGHPIEFCVPDDKAQEEEVMAGIYKGVKSGDLEMGGRLLGKAARDLQASGKAHVLLAACTEIPLVLQTGDVKNDAGEDTPVIDTLKALNTGMLEHAMQLSPGDTAVHSGRNFHVSLAPMSEFAAKAKDFLGGATRLAGFVAGTDPHAGVRLADLAVRLNTAAKKDQDHTQALLDLVVGLPTEPGLVLKELGDAMKRMAKMGAHDVSLATLKDHVHFDALAQGMKNDKLGLRFHHAADESFKQLPAGAKRVALLGTDSGELQDVFAQRARTTGRNLECKAADDEATRLAAAGDLAGAIAHMKSQGIDAVILTSADLAEKAAANEGHALPAIDPQSALAGTAIARSKMRVNVASRTLRQALA